MAGWCSGSKGTETSRGQLVSEGGFTSARQQPVDSVATSPPNQGYIHCPNQIKILEKLGTFNISHLNYKNG